MTLVCGQRHGAKDDADGAHRRSANGSKPFDDGAHLGASPFQFQNRPNSNQFNFERQLGTHPLDFQNHLGISDQQLLLLNQLGLQNQVPTRQNPFQNQLGFQNLGNQGLGELQNRFAGGNRFNSGLDQGTNQMLLQGGQFDSGQRSQFGPFGGTGN